MKRDLKGATVMKTNELIKLYEDQKRLEEQFQLALKRYFTIKLGGLK